MGVRRNFLRGWANFGEFEGRQQPPKVSINTKRPPRTPKTQFLKYRMASADLNNGAEMTFAIQTKYQCKIHQHKTMPLLYAAVS